MKILLTLSLIATSAFAADPDYFKNTVKGLAYVDAFTRATYTFAPGKLEECKQESQRVVCNVKDGSIVFENGGTRGEMVFTSVSIFTYKDAKYPELPDTTFVYKGNYSDNLPVGSQTFGYSVAIAAKGDALTGTFRTFDKLYGSDIGKLYFFGSAK